MIGHHVDGRAVRDLRERQDLTRSQLAARAGVSATWVKYVELGMAQPSGRVAYKLADALKVSASTFVTRIEREDVAA